MPHKEEHFSRSTRMRQSKRISEEMTSLADSSTLVDARPTQKTTNPKDNIQDRTLPPIQKYAASATAASNIEQDKDNSSESSCGSDISDIEGKKLHITTVEKKKEVHRNSSITASIPFNLNIVFDTEMAHLVEVWLEAKSTINDVRLILIANDIKMYDSFKSLDGNN